jgi:hypothetical protein
MYIDPQMLHAEAHDYSHEQHPAQDAKDPSRYVICYCATVHLSYPPACSLQ